MSAVTARSRLEFLLDYTDVLTDTEIETLGALCTAVEARDTEEGS